MSGTPKRKRASKSSKSVPRLSLSKTSGEHTLEDVDQDFAVTRERIRQIEAKALKKLRARPSRSSTRDS